MGPEFFHSLSEIICLAAAAITLVCPWAAARERFQINLKLKVVIMTGLIIRTKLSFVILDRN